MCLLGCEIGSSSVKVSIVESETGNVLASDFYPKEEAPMYAERPGWAEQNPDNWWIYLKLALNGALAKTGIKGDDIKAIGISYQMHGLVLVDSKMHVLRPSIIWCDSRAVKYGDRAFRSIGEKKCLTHILNSPGNFTASKLAWVKDYEPAIYKDIYKFMLPGDYIAMRLTGEINTTIPGLSEAMLWDFRENHVFYDLMDYYGIDHDMLPETCPTFGNQGELLGTVATELGLKKGIPVTYRIGDQSNNAFSLNVLHPGEIGATTRTSGVVYGVNGKIEYDPLSRVNTFAHVNHSPEQPRLGTLLCVNGVGILNSWIKKNVAPYGITYAGMNKLAETVPIGCDGLSILPFGNGAERMLQNKQVDCSVLGLNFNIHGKAHLARAAQEGIVFALKQGMDLMNEMGIDIRVIRASRSNMFLSALFREALACVTGTVIELYDTNGSIGAAQGAGYGAGIYQSPEEAVSSLQQVAVVEPDGLLADKYCAAYDLWKERLDLQLQK